MKIYSNGRDRVLTGQFPKNFKLRNNGIDVPFIRTGADSIRLSGEVPVGDLDILEVIKEVVKPQSDLTKNIRFAMINENELKRIENLSKTLEEKGTEFEQKGVSLEKKAESLFEKEDKNAQAIQETNSRLESMARAVGKEIQADRESLRATSSGIKQVITKTAEVLDAKLQAHEVAKNPHKITKGMIGLDAVDNTSDLDKPISKATKKALDKKADKTAIEDLDKKIEEAGKKQESFQKSFENVNLYGGVGGDIIRGGKIGQILSKASNMDGDYKWVDAKSGIEIIRVDELPDEGKTSVLYLVPSTDPESENIYDEYIWAVQSDDTYAWEKIGTTEIDLSDYEHKTAIEELDATDSITLADNTIYNGGEQTSLTIALPATDTIGFICEVDFSSGSTATTLSYSLPDIFWEGTDVAYDATAQKNIFTPVANKRYTIVFYFDGVNYNGRVGGV